MTTHSKIARKLLIRHREELTWGEVQSAIDGATDTQRQRIVNALKKSRPQLAGKVLGNIVFVYLKADAEKEATDMLADESLSLEELDRVL